MTEIWRDIGGYDSYQVSNFGRVRRFYKHTPPHILKALPNRGGYLRVDLCRDGKHHSTYVHRLVALAFIDNPKNKPQVNHINGNKTDNRVENLEWVTHDENMHHAAVTGLRRQGAEHPDAKFTNEQARFIRDNPDGLTRAQLAHRFGVYPQTISAIQLGYAYETAGGTIRKPIGTRISDDIRTEIRRLYVRGSREFGSTALAKKFGVTPAAILKIIHEN